MADLTIDNLYQKKAALDQIGSDATAMSAANFDRVEIISDPVRGPIKYGYDAELGENFEISKTEAPPTDAVSEPNIKTVIEDGVSFDVEVLADGSEFLLGKTGEKRSGVKAQLKGPTEPEPPKEEDDGTVDVLKDVGRGVVSGALKGAEEFNKALRLDGVVDYIGDQLKSLGVDTSIDVDKPKGLAGQLTEPFAQGLTVMAPAAVTLGALGVTSAFLRWTLAGAAGDTLAFAPDAPAFGELAEDLGKLDNAALEALRVGIAEAFKKNEGDSELKKRIKNLGGGVLAGSTIDGLVGMFRAAKGLKNAPKAVKEKLRKFITEAETEFGGANAADVALAVKGELPGRGSLGDAEALPTPGSFQARKLPSNISALREISNNPNVDELRSMAEAVKDRATRQGADAEIVRGGSAAGETFYVDFSLSGFSANRIRISDHSVGPARLSEAAINVRSGKQIDDALKAVDDYVGSVIARADEIQSAKKAITDADKAKWKKIKKRKNAEKRENDFLKELSAKTGFDEKTIRSALSERVFGPPKTTKVLRDAADVALAARAKPELFDSGSIIGPDNPKFSFPNNPPPPPKHLRPEQASAWQRVPIVAEKVRKMLGEKFDVPIEVSISDGNFGRSYYLYPHLRYSDGFQRAIRVSDHGANARTHVVEARIDPLADLEPQFNKAIKILLANLAADTGGSVGAAGTAVALPVAAQGQDKEDDAVELAGLIDRFLTRAVRAAKEVPTARPKPGKAPHIDAPGAPKIPPIGRVSTTEEAMAAFENVAKGKAAEIKKATRGKVALKETEQAGRRMEREVLDLMGETGDSVTDFMAGLASSVKNLDARVQAARELLVASMELAMDRATAIVKPLEEISDKELFDFLEQEARHNQLQILFTGARAEIGRALGSFRNVAESAGDVSLTAKERTSQVIAEAIQQAGGKKAIVARAAALLATPPEKRGGLIKAAQHATALDVIQEIFINNLLFGLRTQEINFASTQAFMLWQPVERLAAAMIGVGRRALGSTDETVQMNEAVALLVGYVEGIPDSAKVAWQVFRTETPADPLTKIETSRFRAISSERLGLDPNSALGKAIDIYGVYQRLPGRGLSSVDEFNKGIARNMERRAQAVRLSNAALDEGVEPKEAAQLYADIMAGRNDAAEEAAKSFADTVTFTRQLGEGGQALQKAIRKVPGVFVAWPFLRTPANLFKEFIYRGPQAVLSPKVYRDFMAGGIARDMAIAKVGLGTGLMAWATTLASNGIITGYGPTNFKQRGPWLEKNQPYAINLRKMLGDEQFEKMGLEREWLPFGGLEPLDTLFGVASNYAQWKMWGPIDQVQEEEELISVAALGAVIQNIGDKTYLQGVAQAAEAFKEPGRYLERYLANIVSRAIPFVGTTMSADIESAISPPRSDVRRDPNETNPAINHFYAVLNKVMARTPGLSASLPPNVTDDGVDIVAFEGNWINAFNRFAPKGDKATPYHEELIRLRYPLSKPARAAFGVKLTPGQYHKMMKAFNEIKMEYVPGDGKPINKLAALNRLVASAQYNAQFTVEAKIDLLKRVRSKYLDVAKNAMVDVTNETGFFDSDLFAAKIERGAIVGTPDFLEPQP